MGDLYIKNTPCYGTRVYSDLSFRITSNQKINWYNTETNSFKSKIKLCLCNMDAIRRQTAFDMVYLLTAIGLPTGGSSTVHIDTQTIHRTTHRTTQKINRMTQNKQYTEQHTERRKKYTELHKTNTSHNNTQNDKKQTLYRTTHRTTQNKQYTEQHTERRKKYTKQTLHITTHRTTRNKQYTEQQTERHNKQYTEQHTSLTANAIAATCFGCTKHSSSGRMYKEI